MGIFCPLPRVLLTTWRLALSSSYRPLLEYFSFYLALTCVHGFLSLQTVSL